MVYIIGYTFQCVVTKSAQSCLTNDPKQRPLFSIFDGVYNTIVFALIPIFVSSYLVPKHGGFNLAFFHEFWCYVAATSGILTCIAIYCISSKDRLEYFGTGKVVKIGFKDYWEVLKNNRAIQMLVVAHPQINWRPLSEAIPPSALFCTQSSAATMRCLVR